MNRQLTFNFALILLVLTLSSFSSRSYADDKSPSGIMGRITTIDGSVVPCAQIQISRGGSKVATKANTNGEYWIELKPGLYEVSVDHAGFKFATRKDITVHANSKAVVDIVLQTGKLITGL